MRSEKEERDYTALKVWSGVNKHSWKNTQYINKYWDGLCTSIHEVHFHVTVSTQKQHMKKTYITKDVHLMKCYNA